MRILVFIPYDKTNGRALRSAFKNAGKKFHLVRFIPLGGNPGLSRLPSVQFVLYEISINFNSGRATVNNSPYPCTMGFSK
jgi:hypothetical protein